MTTEELKALKSDKVVDARGTACPGPLLAAKKSSCQHSARSDNGNIVVRRRHYKRHSQVVQKNELRIFRCH